MTTKHIPGQQGLASGVERNTALLFGRIGTGSADMLCGLKEFRRDNLQVQQHLGSAIAAAEYAGIGEVADDTPDAGVVPHLNAFIRFLLYTANAISRFKIFQYASSANPNSRSRYQSI